MPDERKTLRLTCPVCETRLKVAENIERFACLNCGTELNLVREGNIAQLEPTHEAVAQLSPEQRELVNVSTALKSKDDSYGSGCAVATLGITLVACISILLAGASNQPILFWTTIISALVILAVVLLLFINASGKATAPLMRRRDQLQNSVVQQQQDVGGNTPNSDTSETPSASEGGTA